MSKPLVTFADPEAAIVAYLKAAYAIRSETYKPATVTNGYPSTALTTTHVQVELDGSNVADYPVTDRATVRVTCHAGPNDPSKAKNLATLTQGLLYAHPGDAQVHGTTPLTGRIKAVDPATKNHMVSFTFRVDLKAVQLAS